MKIFGRFGTGVAVGAIATLFATGLVYRQPGIDLFAHYAIVPLFLLAGYALSGGAIGRTVVTVIVALTLHAAWSFACFGGAPAAAAQQIVGISAMLLTFDYILRSNNFDLGKLLTIYLHGCVAVAAVGLFQLLSFLVDFTPGYDFSWLLPDYHLQFNQVGVIRVQSVMLEPAHFGIVCAGGIFVAVLNLTGRTAHFISRPASVVILAAAAATFSTVALAAILLSLAVVAVDRGSLGRVAGAAIVAAACVFAYEALPDVRLRVDDTMALLLHRSDASANLSSLTLYNNAHVAWQSLLATNFFGGGLGSHPLSFERFSLLYGMSELPLRYAMLNAADASALGLRIASELGAPGLIATALFLVRFHVPRRRSADRSAGAGHEAALLWIVSNASLVFLLVSLVRQGHYFNFGLPFFGLVYLEAGRAYRALTRMHAEFAAAARPA